MKPPLPSPTSRRPSPRSPRGHGVPESEHFPCTGPRSVRPLAPGVCHLGVPREWRLGSARAVACVTAPTPLGRVCPSCGQTHVLGPLTVVSPVPCVTCVCSRACGRRGAVPRAPRGRRAAGRVGTLSVTLRGPATRLPRCRGVSRSRAPFPTTSPARTVRFLDHGRLSGWDDCVTVGWGRSSEIFLK